MNRLLLGFMAAINLGLLAGCDSKPSARAGSSGKPSSSPSTQPTPDSGMRQIADALAGINTKEDVEKAKPRLAELSDKADEAKRYSTTAGMSVEEETDYRISLFKDFATNIPRANSEYQRIKQKLGQDAAKDVRAALDMDEKDFNRVIVRSPDFREQIKKQAVENRAIYGMGHLRMLATGCMIYANDHQGKWPDDLKSLIASNNIAADPLLYKAAGSNTKLPDNFKSMPQDKLADWAQSQGDLIYLGNGKKLTGIPKPSVFILAYENPQRVDHDPAVAFADGHAEALKPDDLAKRLAAQK